MAIAKVRVKINGTWTNLSHDSSGKWTGNITAPSTTSFNQSGGYYPVVIEVTNDAGTVKTWEATDATWGNVLRLQVKETTKPVITLVSPSNGAYVTNNKQPITFKVTDEAGGSGVKLSAVSLKIDSTTYNYNSTGMTYAEITNGYQFVFTPSTALSDGKHSLAINSADNDGNAAGAVTASITVDTVPPTLSIITPEAGTITNSANVTVSGTTNDAISSPVTVKVVLNGVDQGTVTVGSDGTFSKAVSLAEGENTIVVTATDAAGKSSSVTRTVTLDTSIPAISSVVLTPNPVNASASVVVTVEVS
ncbi:MAG: hypothetical protein IJ335_01245 [Lachnospiraceae bacterium]|nr:hypothetical protein [Lachnospiraceae bacterium]